MATTYNFIAQNKRKSWLLIIGFLIFAGLLGYLFGYLNDAGYFGTIVAFVIAIPSALISYFASDKIALAVNGAVEVNPQGSAEERQVYRLVENLAITAGIPTPRVYVIPDTALNAFATGRDPEHASIAITTGLLNRLEKTEVEGVIAHELSHVKNYDIRLSTLVVVLVGFIALLSDFFLRFSFLGGRRRSSDRDAGQLGGILAIIGIVLMILAPIFARLISLAVSRQREFLADASGVLLTRYPEGLARALEKIEHDPNVLQRANNATMHLYLSNPYEGEEKKSRGGLARLFSTHPPIEERIHRLREMNL